MEITTTRNQGDVPMRDRGARSLRALAQVKLGRSVGETREMLRRMLGGALAWAAILAAGPALAHHPTGGRIPGSALEGFLSGLAHPVIGPDHLAFVIGVGILSAFVRRGPLLPVVFLCFGAVGTAIHLGGFGLPAGESLVALSVLLMGAAVWLRRRAPSVPLGMLCGFGGLAHGYALAESVVGAEPSPLGFYLAGLVIVQLAISLLVQQAVRYVASERPLLARRAAAAASAAMLLMGVALLPWPA